MKIESLIALEYIEKFDLENPNNHSEVFGYMGAIDLNELFFQLPDMPYCDGVYVLIGFASILNDQEFYADVRKFLQKNFIVAKNRGWALLPMTRYETLAFCVSCLQYVRGKIYESEIRARNTVATNANYT